LKIFSFAISTALVASTAFAGGTGAVPRWATDFSVASINVERNATDGDTEVVISVVPGDEGLKYLTLRAPNKRTVFETFSLDRSVLGIREFNLESPEPPGEAILSAYPQGVYQFTGRSVTGEWFRSEVRLSHLMPAEPVITFPAEESEVPVGSIRIEWSAVPGLQKVVLELENESTNPEQVMTAELPADATSFDVPASFIQPGGEYQIGVAAVGLNGNITVVESTFTTAE
jgi:hypothetical protein